MSVTTYSDSLAVLLAEHAAAVYCDDHLYWKWTIKHGFEGTTVITKGSTQIGIAYSPTMIVVAARGSSQLGDWGENALTIPWRWRDVFPVGRTHLGFQIQARRIHAEFCESVGELRQRYPNAKVFVTGHSLGGALCAYLARFLSLAGMPADAIYTFESPRVGTGEWSLWFDTTYGPRTFRVIMERRGCADIVTRVPPSAWGWRHVGQPVIIRDGYRYESESEWERLRDQHPVRPIAQWRILGELVTGVRAHLADQMVADLRAVVARSARGLV